MIVSCQRTVAKRFARSRARRRFSRLRSSDSPAGHSLVARPYLRLEQSISRTCCEKPAPWNVGYLVADRNNVDHSMRRNRCCTPETSKHVIVVQTQRSGSGRYSDDPDSS